MDEFRRCCCGSFFQTGCLKLWEEALKISACHPHQFLHPSPNPQTSQRMHPTPDASPAPSSKDLRFSSATFSASAALSRFTTVQWSHLVQCRTPSFGPPAGLQCEESRTRMTAMALHLVGTSKSQQYLDECRAILCNTNRTINHEPQNNIDYRRGICYYRLQDKSQRKLSRLSFDL